MKRSLLIIFGHLAAQALIAFGIAYKLYSTTLHSSQGQIFWISREQYLAIYGFIFILLSFVLIFFLRKQYRIPLLLSTLLSCAAWAISGSILTKSLADRNAAEVRASMNNWNDLTKTGTLEYAKQMNFQSIVWDTVRVACLARERNGAEHVFSVNQHNVWAACRVQRPAIDDTLGWLNLTVKEASFYLNADACKSFSLGIDSGRYNFYADQESFVRVEITPVNAGKSFPGIRGTACRKADRMCYNYYGNFLVQVSDQTELRK